MDKIPFRSLPPKGERRRVRRRLVKNPITFLPDSQPDERIDKNNFDTMEQGSKTYLSDILKVIFEILIILLGIGLVVFLFIYGMKMKRKKMIKKSNMLFKKQRLMEMN